MRGAEANEYEIWFMQPNLDLTSVMHYGVGKCRIEFLNCWVVLTLSDVMRNHKKLAGQTKISEG